MLSIVPRHLTSVERENLPTNQDSHGRKELPTNQDSHSHKDLPSNQQASNNQQSSKNQHLYNRNDASPGWPSRWQANLALTLKQTERGTRLIRNIHKGPLQVQTPFYPEGPDLAHMYILHPPGGLVSGDELNIVTDMLPASGALITTPGAGRVYRARQDGSPQQQKIVFNLANCASMEWMPQETVIFPSANGNFQLDVYLSEKSVFCGWEITCLGLSLNHQPFDQGTIQQRIRLYRHDKLIFQEGFYFQAPSFPFSQSSAGLQGFSVSAVFVCSSFNHLTEPLQEALVNKLQALLNDENKTSILCAVTVIGECLCVRYLGDCSAHARAIFIQVWSILRPELLKRQVCIPRIWAT